MTCRLAKCHHSNHPGWSKIFRVWVNLVTELKVFCRKFYLLLEFIIYFSKSSGKGREYYFSSISCELIVVFKCISMILSDFLCVLFKLFCHKFGIVKNHALFWVTFFALNFDGVNKITFCKSDVTCDINHMTCDK